MAYDRKQFFKRFRDAHGPLTQEQVNGIEFLLGKIEADPLWINAAEVSYALATVAWETAWTFQPIDERGGNAYFEQHYGWRTAKGKELGNKAAGEGAMYHGRGFVQLTGKANYAKATKLLPDYYPGLNVDLVSNPADAKRTDVAYGVMALGMHQGWFTGKKLSQYFSAKTINFKAARKIINGTDHDDEIAEIAQNFFESLVVISDAEKPEELTQAPDPPATTSPTEGGGTEQAAPSSQPTQALEAVTVPAIPPAKTEVPNAFKRFMAWAGGASISSYIGSLVFFKDHPDILMAILPLIKLTLYGVEGVAIVGTVMYFVERIASKKHANELNQTRLQNFADPNTANVDFKGWRSQMPHEQMEDAK